MMDSPPPTRACTAECFGRGSTGRVSSATGVPMPTASPCMGAADWPMSREEKKAHVMGLYDRDLQMAGILLQEATEKTEALKRQERERYLIASRRSSSCCSVAADLSERFSDDGAGPDPRRLSYASTVATSASVDPAVAQQAAEKLRKAVEEAAATLGALLPAAQSAAADAPKRKDGREEKEDEDFWRGIQRAARARSESSAGLKQLNQQRAPRPCARGPSRSTRGGLSTVVDRKPRHSQPRRRSLDSQDLASEDWHSSDSAREADCENYSGVVVSKPRQRSRRGTRASPHQPEIPEVSNSPYPGFDGSGAAMLRTRRKSAPPQQTQTPTSAVATGVQSPTSCPRPLQSLESFLGSDNRPSPSPSRSIGACSRAGGSDQKADVRSPPVARQLFAGAAGVTATVQGLMSLEAFIS
eukprot:TRINITY_DN94244_c0_g1_i1.p1 TRINITY_DN94244_c0_g1~~TRINITY_DN94244_c0_g1_i1.p1  ORF type:complete len:414 (+),score=82.36 TRINITY_DN94244_c0_g1_i1:72-1313(+)